VGNIRTASPPSQPRRDFQDGRISLFPTGQSPWTPFESRRRPATRSAKPCCAAVALFLEQGYPGTAQPRGRAANITKPALYNYFREQGRNPLRMLGDQRERVDERIDEIAAAGGTGLRNCAS
jgi:hypothetical protein